MFIEAFFPRLKLFCSPFEMHLHIMCSSFRPTFSYDLAVQKWLGKYDNINSRWLSQCSWFRCFSRALLNCNHVHSSVQIYFKKEIQDTFSILYSHVNNFICGQFNMWLFFIMSVIMTLFKWHFFKSLLLLLKYYLYFNSTLSVMPHVLFVS